MASVVHHTRSIAPGRPRPFNFAHHPDMYTVTLLVRGPTNVGKTNILDFFWASIKLQNLALSGTANRRILIAF